MYPMDTVKPLWKYMIFQQSYSQLSSLSLGLSRVMSSGAAGVCVSC